MYLRVDGLSSDELLEIYEAYTGKDEGIHILYVWSAFRSGENAEYWATTLQEAEKLQADFPDEKGWDTNLLTPDEWFTRDEKGHPITEAEASERRRDGNG